MLRECPPTPQSEPNVRCTAHGPSFASLRYNWWVMRCISSPLYLWNWLWSPCSMLRKLDLGVCKTNWILEVCSYGIAWVQCLIKRLCGGGNVIVTPLVTHEFVTLLWLLGTNYCFIMAANCTYVVHTKYIKCTHTNWGLTINSCLVTIWF